MQLQDTFKVPYYVAEFDADGNQAMDVGDSVALTVDDATKATIAADSAVDASKVPAPLDATKILQTGFIVGGKTVGDANITSTFTHTDGTPAPPVQVTTITIVSGPPVAGGLNLGTPVAQ